MGNLEGQHPLLGTGLSTRFGSFSRRAQVSQEQEQGEAEGEGAANQEVAGDGVSDQECLIHAEGIHEKSPD